MRTLAIPLIALTLAGPLATGARAQEDEAPPAATDDGGAPAADADAAAPEGDWDGDDPQATREGRSDEEPWQDDRAAEEEEEEKEFDTNWVGARFGAWYHPTFTFSAEVSGQSGLGGLLGTSLDAERDLKVTENPKSDFLIDFDQSTVLEIGGYIETRFVSVYGWWVAPFEYQGEAVVSRELNFGGYTFAINDTVKSRFRQFFLGADLELNILNDRYFRISPLVSGRMIAIDWEVKETVLNVGGNTDDIDTPLAWRGYQLIPLAEVGVDVRLGVRDYFEVGVRAAGAWVSYAGIEGTTFRLEATATVYPISFLGIELGVRHMAWNVGSASDDPNDQFELDLRYTGAMAAIILRLG